MSTSTAWPQLEADTEIATSEERETILEIAQRVREEKENLWREDENVPVNVTGACQILSLALVEELKKRGFAARATFGMYLDCEDGYPETLDWQGRCVGPDDDLDDWDNTWTHWWVSYKNLIIDLSADQFHPSEPDEYRVVITERGDYNYSC